MDKRFRVGQYSQEDILEKLIFPNNEQHKGLFIEIGSWDGIDISNSYWLEKCKDWTGLLVEPINSKADWAKHNRWCDVWNGCVYNRDGEVEFTHINGYSEMLSGIEEAYHPSQKERVNKEITQFNQTVEKIKLPCKTINSLMDTKNLKKADFLSLDVQTAELQVLKAYDPVKNPIKAILLDMNGSNQTELIKWFRDNNYKLYWKHPEIDEHIFVHSEFKWTWE